MDFDWNLIKSLRAVAKGKSLSAAARQLGSSQPTIGRHIGELEVALGVTLFERVPRGMVPTEAGLALLEHAERIYAEAAALSLAATGQSKDIAGTVRISASEFVAHFILPEIVSALHSRENSLQIEIVSTNTVQNLLMRDADIAIRMVAPSQSELIGKKVNEIRLGAFATRDYVRKRGVPKTPEGLFSHTLIGYDRNDLILREFRARGYSVQREDFSIRTDDQVLNWRLVEAGAGIGFGQVHVARRNQDMVRILPDLDLPMLPVWVVAHRELRTTRRIRFVFDHLCAALRALPLSGPD